MALDVNAMKPAAAQQQLQQSKRSTPQLYAPCGSSSSCCCCCACAATAGAAPVACHIRWRGLALGCLFCCNRIGLGDREEGDILLLLPAPPRVSLCEVFPLNKPPCTETQLLPRQASLQELTRTAASPRSPQCRSDVRRQVTTP